MPCAQAKPAVVPLGEGSQQQRSSGGGSDSGGALVIPRGQPGRIAA